MCITFLPRSWQKGYTLFTHLFIFIISSPLNSDRAKNIGSKLKHMQKNLTFTALSTIGDACVEFENLFEAILIAGYGASSARVEAVRRRIEDRQSLAGQQLVMLRENKKRCRALIKRLEQQGLIEHVQKRGKIFINITERGTSRLARIQERKTIKEAPMTAQAKNARWIIIVFDIPEKKRCKRDWIRRTLNTMGFTMIQRSVWMGQTILPKAFVENITKQDIAPYVEILEVTREGSVDRLALHTPYQQKTPAQNNT